MRKAAERTQESLWAKIGALLPSLKPQHAANYFAAA